MSSVDPLRTGRYRERLRQLTEVAAPFRSLMAKWTDDPRVRAEAQVLARLRKSSDGSAITMPLESVIGTGIRT